jgi:hypothetical protein
VMGGGWTHLMAPDQPVNMSLGVVIAVPWTETNRRHELVVSLMDDDGQRVTMGEQGEQPVVTAGRIEVGRPAGVKPDSAINAVIAFNFNGLVLPEGGYVWMLRMAQTEVRTPFWVVSPG